MSKEPIILGIESSCDDTSAAILQGQKILSNEIANQEIHSLYGGVVPELASRAHQQNIIPVVDTAIKKANINKEDIDAIAFTKGPGLLGSLIVGSSFSKSFALGMNIPLITVNHMQAHILSHFIDEGEPMPEFPFLCLTVSGGHTQIVRVDSPSNMEVIGTTLDDAAGEAFDKSAKILGLPYPGGPLIDKHAKNGNILAFEFGKPNIKNLDFSFSGLKTHTATCLKQHGHNAQDIADIAAGFEMAVVDSLIIKIKRAIKQEKIKNLVIAGGVAANQLLRTKINILSKELKLNVIFPQPQYCTDNGAMVAVTGYLKLLASQNNLTTNLKIQTHPRWPLG